jgi:antibiotic biosynthesis monooxygenase (ABM) superfamily enzyme
MKQLLPLAAPAVVVGVVAVVAAAAPAAPTITPTPTTPAPTNLFSPSCMTAYLSYIFCPLTTRQHQAHPYQQQQQQQQQHQQQQQKNSEKIY